MPAYTTLPVPQRIRQLKDELFCAATRILL